MNARVLLFFIAGACALTGQARSAGAAPPRFGIVIHGGAGTIIRKEMTPTLEAEYREKLGEALAAGYAILDQGGTSLDAVVAAITVLEDSPRFNAGKGAVLNADGICELDASIMHGGTLAAGAVAGVRHIKNPIRLARDVMEKSEHVMMAGEGAERFARGLGYELVPNEYFQTDLRRQQLENARRQEAARATNPSKKSAVVPAPGPSDPGTGGERILARESKFGTVGAVALDKAGNLAAGTSTGGMTNKRFGRIGDSPIIGAGTFADNATAAVSCTGHGEYFIRAGVAREVAALMAYKGVPLAEAAGAALEKARRMGGTGGLIAIDAQGNIALPFNTAGMYRGHHLAGRPAIVEIYGAGK
jgi:beta-aspartyl-peptidase (threonine type)